METNLPKHLDTAKKKKEARSQLVLALMKYGLFLQRELGQVFQQLALNANQFTVINEIILQGPLSQKDLCTRLLFEKSNISKIVKTLHEKELISISIAPGDRRYTLLIETPQGLELWRECLKSFNNSSTDMLSVLSNEEILSTLKILNRLGKSLKDQNLK